MSGSGRVVCFPFVGDEIGGSHISAAGLIERLDRSRFVPLVLLHHRAGPVADLLARRGIDFEAAPPVRLPALADGRGSRLSLANGALRFAAAAPRLARFLVRRRVDIVHTNDGRMHVAWGLAARLAGARHLWHHRGDPDAFGVNRIAPWLSHHIVTVSCFARPAHPVRPVFGRLSVVHSPFERRAGALDRAASRAQLDAETGCGRDTRVVGYVGLLIDRKRPLVFVEAVHAYARAHPEMPVLGLLFGVPARDGPPLDAAVKERAAALGIADRIRLMGFRQPSEPWIAALDALVVPAVREPFGRTLIEAMLLGTPVVAARDGGNVEAIEDGVTGFLVDPDRPEAFVAPLHRLFTDPALRAVLTETARRQAGAAYGAERHVEALSRIYARLLGAAAPGTERGHLGLPPAGGADPNPPTSQR